ncbi:FIG00911085: hypothetical protein [Sphingobium indicum BiD32]|uniref:Conjugal transfer protein TraN n=1 Tax=Sphingobium indicum BiD32 TaxID=1301087 RepID=N1MHX7_9SPHN|nr:hypothetical protein [Sphingobium indicum]CCW16556.1 FIG00911085: hypothetical protein [Sphingobium indicum BiD32]
MKRLPLMLAGTVLMLPSVLHAQSMDDRARAAAAATKAKTGDSDTLLKNYVTPGMSGQPVATVDGTKTFTPTLACQKTANLLEVLIQPSSSGDIGVVRISRDKDLDGTFDSSSALPVPVSGICANGVISCQPGTWTQCHSFRWNLDSAKDLKLTEVDMPELSGCYCVNNSCGSNLVFGNLASVLKDLGGGMVGALTTADPRIGVAEARINGPVIDYVGAQTTACTSSPAIGQTVYRANPAAIQGDAFALSSSNPVFQALAASSAGAGKAQQLRSCTITREVTLREVAVDDVISRTAGGYATIAGTGGSADFLMGSPGNNSLRGGGCSLFDFRMTLHVGDPDRLKSVTLPVYSADDWAQVRIDGMLVAYGPGAWTGSGYPPGNCEQDHTTFYAPNTDLKPLLTKGDHEIWLRVAVADRGDAFAQIHAEVDTSCKTTERIVDLCLGYGADPKCRLSAEDVDGVQTFRNGVATGLRPLPQTRLFGNANCTLQFTRDFFERTRTYACTTDSTALPAPDLSRGAYIIDHSTETLLADRTKAADGSITTSTRNFSIPPQGTVPACEAICKTRAPKANTAAAPDGVVASRQNAPTGYDTFYHTCDAANVCPAGPGEEIVSACGCVDDFPEAVVMMQTVRLAGADMVCTSAVP